MYGLIEGEWDWLDHVDTDKVEEYAERFAPHVMAAIQGGPEVEMPSAVAQESGFDWKWGALAVLTGALAISMLRKK